MKQITQVDLRNIGLNEGIDYILSTVKASNLPVNVYNSVVKDLGVIKESSWLNIDAKEKAQDAVESVIHAIVNNLPTQVSYHLDELIRAHNFNRSLQTIKVMKEHKCDAKLFASYPEPEEEFSIKGQGFQWKLTTIKKSSEKVPTEFIKRLTILRYNSIVPDLVYIAVPHGEIKPSLKTVVSSDIQNSYLLAKTVISKQKQKMLELSTRVDRYVDPLLICGFGTKYTYLVQIGKWE